jgi:hypothetical protein
MKKTLQFLVLTASIAFVSFQTSNAQVLSNFGTTAFAIDTDNSTLPFSQSGTSFTGTDTNGILAGVFTTPFSLSSSSPLRLNFSFTGTNQNSGFTLEFLTPTFTSIATYSGSTAGATTSSVTTQLTLTTGASFTNQSVGGVNITLNGAGGQTVSYQFQSLEVVPEPSTYALMAIGGLVLFFIARRRKAQV